MTRSPFEVSLAALRDNVVMAVERREMGVVQDGLDVYQHLIEHILDEQLRLQAAIATASGPNLPLGREWEQIVRDLHGIVDSVSASPSRLLWVDVLSWVRRVAVACAERGVLNVLGMILTLFESAWSQELAEPSADASSRQDALLLRLSEFGRFYLGRIHFTPEVGRGADVIYTRTFLRIVKRAIESGSGDAARVAIKYFLHGKTTSGASLGPVAGAGLLALYAWLLYRFDHGNQDDYFRALCAQLANSFDDDEDFVQMLLASDELENELGVHWWELDERAPMSSGFIQINTYMALALMLVAGPGLTLQSVDPENAEEAAAARRLVSVIDSWETGGFPGVRATLGLAVDHFDELKERLANVVEQGDVALEESYSRLPVDPSRLSIFRSAVASELATARKDSIVAALLVPVADALAPGMVKSASDSEPDESGAVPPISAKPVPAAPNFGLDSLIPRWYFAETDVVADPEHLAADLVRGLMRGEEDQILDLALGDFGSASEITLESLRATLSGAATDIARPVVVTNSYHAYAVLVGRRSVGLLDKQASEFKAGPVIRVYDDRREYVALLSAGISPVVQLLTPAPEMEGDVVLEDQAVLIGVNELAPEEMEGVIARANRTRIDEARLRGSLRVRLLEHLVVTLSPDAAPSIWWLPESIW